MAKQSKKKPTRRRLTDSKAGQGERLHPADRHKLLVYIANFLRRAGVNGNRGYGRRDEIADAAGMLGIEPPELHDDPDPEWDIPPEATPRRRATSPLRHFDKQEIFRNISASEILRLFDDAAEAAGQLRTASKPSLYGGRLDEIAKTFDFSPEEKQVLDCAVMTALHPLVREALSIRRVGYGSEFYPECIAFATGLPLHTVSKVTSRSTLSDCGMVSTASDGEVRVSDQLLLAVRLGWRGKHGLANCFVGQPVKASLD